MGAGLVMLAYGNVNLQKDVPLTAQNRRPLRPHVTLTGKAKQSFGYNAGIFFKPSDKLSVGVSYRSQIDAKIENGDVRLRDVHCLDRRQLYGHQLQRDAAPAGHGQCGRSHACRMKN